MVGDDPPEALEDRGTGPDDACFARARGARAAGSGITVKLADRTCSTRFGARPHTEPSSDRSVIRRSLGEHLARQDGDVAAHEHVIDLTVRSVRGPRAPAHRASPCRAARPRRRAPRSCSRRRPRPVAPATAAAVAALGGGAAARAARASTTCARRRRRPRPVDVDRAHQRRARTVRIVRDRCRSASSARDDREPRADRDLHVPLTGNRVARAAAG